MRIAIAMLLVELYAAAAGAPARGQTFAEGKSAYDRNQVAEAERIYARIVADPTAPVPDRSAANRELARIAWLIDSNAKRALEHLAAARALGDKPCETAAMTARVLRESNQAAKAIRIGDSLLASCPEPFGRDEIRTHLVGARLDLAMSKAADRSRLLSGAISEAKKFSIDADIEAARVRLETALLTGDTSSAIAAWKDYFWLDDSDAPQALERVGAATIFANGLRKNAAVEDRLALAELLMRTGFAEQSERYALSHGLAAAAAGNPVFRKLSAYWDERRKLQAVALRVNRGLARGKRDETSLEQAAKASMAALMQAAGASGDPAVALREHYGLFGTVGKTSGYPSMHIGHVVEDRSLVVSQYGKTASIRYISVDNMIGNGFESWLWDGGPMTGGWQANGIIVNVRPGYVKSPLRAFAQTQDGAARRDLIGRQRQRAAEDLAKLKARPVATLDGLSDRLQLQVLDRVGAVARSKAGDEAGLRRAFLAEYSRANFEQSIFIHEGRHAIDEALGLSGKVEQAVLEYRAKLSELALSTYPRMALRNMDLNLEGEGPHDKAGARIFDQYRTWMQAHPDEVIGYDPALPALAQFDKLTDDQIREIARGLDPLPNGRPSPQKL
ncbi:MAG: tetratricopeptide repeat protein [Sphingomicrobium sp.]